MIPIRTSQWHFGTAYVVRSFLLLNVLIFLFMLMMDPGQGRTAVLVVDGDALTEGTPSRPVQYPSSSRDDFTIRYGAVPEIIVGFLDGNNATHEFIEDNRFSRSGRIHGEGIGIDLLDGFLLLFTPLTAMFIHAGWLHLIGNMLFLWVFGRSVEGRLGHLRFALFYLVVGYLAAAAHIFFDSSDLLPMIGASGAISGILGAHLLLFPRVMVQVLVPIILLIPLVIPGPVMIGFWFIINFFNGISSIASETSGSGGTAWFAHLGGFAAGLLLVYPFLIGRWRAPIGELSPNWNLPPMISGQVCNIFHSPRPLIDRILFRSGLGRIYRFLLSFSVLFRRFIRRRSSGGTDIFRYPPKKPSD